MHDFAVSKASGELFKGGAYSGNAFQNSGIGQHGDVVLGEVDSCLK